MSGISAFTIITVNDYKRHFWQFVLRTKWRNVYGIFFFGGGGSSYTLLPKNPDLEL
jgi:hypothetical protein